MNDQDRALLVAGLMMDFPKASPPDVQVVVDRAAAQVSLVLPDVPLAKVEEIAREQLEARTSPDRATGEDRGGPAAPG